MMSIKTHTVKCPIDEPLKKRYTVLEKFLVRTKGAVADVGKNQ